MASSWVDKLGLPKRSGLRLFAEVSPLEPLLVSVKRKQAHPYYIVPFGAQRAEDQVRRSIKRVMAPRVLQSVEVQAAMILNAYNGEFEESIVLPKGCFFKFQAPDEALKLAVEKFRVPQEWLSPPKLIFTPSIETPSRFLPVWHFRLQRDLYVTPLPEAVIKLATTEEELWKRLNRKY